MKFVSCGRGYIISLYRKFVFHKMSSALYNFSESLGLVIIYSFPLTRIFQFMLIFVPVYSFLQLLPECSPHSVINILELLGIRHCAGCQFFRAEARGQVWDAHGDHIKDVNFHYSSTLLHVISNPKLLCFDRMSKMNYRYSSQFGYFDYVEGLRKSVHVINILPAMSGQIVLHKMECLEHYFDFVIYIALENHGSNRKGYVCISSAAKMFRSSLFIPQNCVLFLRSYRCVLHILYVV